MVGTAAMAWWLPVDVPGWIRPAALIVLGLGLGQGFSGPVLSAVIGALPVLILAGTLTIVAGLFVARVFMHLAGTDARTGFFCAVPGGIVVMAVLAQRAGASVAAVTLAQTLRMVCVVLLFPPALAILAPNAVHSAFAQELLPFYWPGLLAVLAGATAVALAIGRFGMASPWLLPSCLLAVGLSAAGRMPSGIPVWLVDIAQIGMGAALGLRLTRRFLLASRRLAVASLGSVVVLSLILAVLGVALGLGFGLPPAAVVLGMAPGGMPEMAITAKALDLAVPLVLGFHLVRVLLCNLLIAPIWRLGLWTGLVK